MYIQYYTVVSDGHRSFFLFSYAILFPIPILNSLPDLFPIPILFIYSINTILFHNSKQYIYIYIYI